MPKMRLRPRWGSLQCSPRPLAGFKGPTSKGKGGHGRGGEEREGTGKGMGREKGRGKGEGKGKGHTGSFSSLRAMG